MKRFIRNHRRWSAVGVVAFVLPVAAVAYMLAHGFGSTTNDAGTIVAPAPVAVSVQVNGDHSSDMWHLGDTKSYSVQINANSGDAYVTQLALSGFTSGTPGCNSTALPGSFTAPVQSINQTISNGNSYTVPAFSVTFVSTAQDQSACAGVSTLVFDWAVS